MNASELRDVAEVADLLQKQITETREQVAEHGRQFAIIDRAQKTFETQIELFRTGMREDQQRTLRAVNDRFNEIKKFVTELFQQMRKDLRNGSE